MTNLFDTPRFLAPLRAGIHEGSAGNPLIDLVTQKLQLPISGTMDYSAVSTFSPAGERRSNRGTAYLRVAAAWYQQVRWLAWLSSLPQQRHYFLP